MTNKTKLDNKVIYKLLSLCFVDNAFLKVSFKLNIKKFCNSAD